jgi:hypothetical protein
MTAAAAPALRCPKCERSIDQTWWYDATHGRCQRCDIEFEFVPLPALTAVPRQVVAKTAEVAADSVCFFHAENRAEAVCDDCGRMLCAVCAVPFMGRVVCPTCIATASTKPESQPVMIKSRVLYDSIALSVAILPLLIFFVTIFTAPLARGLAIYGWNKPSSLVRGRGRWRLIVAAVFALAEIAGWILLFYYTPAMNNGRRH